MKLPFIELTLVGGGKIYINRLHIIHIYQGDNRCFLKVTNSPNLIEVQESYDSVKTRLYE